MERNTLQPLTRRSFLRSLPAAAAAAAGAFSASCGGNAAHRKVVRYWNGFTGPDGRTMLRMDWATYYNKLFVAGLGDRAPEVFILQTLSIPRFALASFVRPVDDLAGPDHGIDIGDLDANVWQAVSVGGKHYGVPLDVWP